MNTTTLTASTSVFELVRFPYTPYRSDCAGCCAPAAPTAAPRHCCGGN
jgi:hypothetical protein